VKAATDGIETPRSTLAVNLRRLGSRLRPHWPAWIALLVVALLALAASLQDPLAPLISLRPARNSRLAWLGQYLVSDPATIQFWTQMLRAARATLEIGVGAAAVAFAVGAPIGLLAATPGGWLLGWPLMKVLSVLRVFPMLILAIVALVALGTGDAMAGTRQVPHAIKLMLVIGLLCAPRVARVAQVALREQRGAAYLAAERDTGAAGRLHALRNAIGPIVACAASTVGAAILCETSLSFLGLGVQPPAPSWGGLLAASVTPMMAGQWRPVVVPGAMILITVGAFAAIARALCAHLDHARINARSSA
jgi:peptide/nickel transport system permease protein